MPVNWIPLLSALALGLIPPLMLINTECRFLGMDDLWNRVVLSRGQGPRRRRWWKLPLVWIDPIRGYVVGTLLMHHTFIYNERTTTLMWISFVLTNLILMLLILTVQTQGRPRQKESISPGGFMAGLILAITLPVIAIGAMAVGLATAVAFRRYAAGYWAASIVAFLGGWQFIGLGPEIAATATVIGSPALISWLKRKPMVTPVRC